MGSWQEANADPVNLIHVSIFRNESLWLPIPKDHPFVNEILFTQYREGLQSSLLPLDSICQLWATWMGLVSAFFRREIGKSTGSRFDW